MKRFTRVGSKVLVPMMVLALVACNGDDGGGVQELEDPPTEGQGGNDGGDLDDGQSDAEDPNDTPDDQDGDEDADGAPNGEDDGSEEGSDDGSDDGDNEPLAVDETPESTDQIDEQLVQAVVDELDERVEQFFVYVVEGESGEEAVADLSLLYTDPALQQRIAQLESENFAAVLRDEPGEVISTVEELRTVDLECVDVVVDRDMREINPSAGPSEPWTITLVPSSDTANGTAWKIAQELPADGAEEAPDGSCSDILL